MALLHDKPMRINGSVRQQIQGRLSSSSTTSWVLMLPSKVLNLKIFLDFYRSLEEKNPFLTHHTFRSCAVESPQSRDSPTMMLYYVHQALFFPRPHTKERKGPGYARLRYYSRELNTRRNTLTLITRATQHVVPRQYNLTYTTCHSLHVSVLTKYGEESSSFGIHTMSGSNM